MYELSLGTNPCSRLWNCIPLYSHTFVISEKQFHFLPYKYLHNITKIAAEYKHILLFTDYCIEVITLSVNKYAYINIYLLNIAVLNRKQEKNRRISTSVGWFFAWTILAGWLVG